jgi:hypothetical protein
MTCRLFFLLAVLFAAARCSTMNVQVDIVSPLVIEEDADRMLMRNSVPEIVAQDDTAVDVMIDRVQQLHQQYYADTADRYRTKAASLSPTAKAAMESAANRLVTDFSFNNPIHDRMRANLKAANAEIRAAVVAPESTNRTNDLVTKIRKRDILVSNFLAFLNSDGATMAAAEVSRIGAAPDTDESRRRFLAAVNATVRNLVGQFGLVDSAFAFAVANADPNRWKKEYDRSFGRARLGDMNLAVKMESPGVFTIKGVTFDPSEVVRLAAKVTTQALVLGTQLAGVPLPTKTPPPNAAGSSLAASSGELEALQSADAQKRAKAADRTDALLTIAQAILREQSGVGGTADERKAAVRSMKATYDAHKTRLTQ